MTTTQRTKAFIVRFADGSAHLEFSGRKHALSYLRANYAVIDDGERILAWDTYEQADNDDGARAAAVATESP
jgi:hypothetical protein